MDDLEKVLRKIASIEEFGNWFASRTWLEIIDGINAPPILSGREGVIVKLIDREQLVAANMVDPVLNDVLHALFALHDSRGHAHEIVIIFYKDGPEFSFDIFHNSHSNASRQLAVILEILSRRIPAPPRPQAAAQSKNLPSRTIAWIEALRQANQPAVAARQKPSRTAETWLAFCIVEPEHPNASLRLELHPATTGKSGAIRVHKAHAATDLNRLPQFITDDDLPILARYQRLLKGRNSWDTDIPIDQHLDAALLDAMLATGRLVWSSCPVSRNASRKALRLIHGGPVPASLAWEEITPAWSHPVIQFPSESHILCGCAPARYIDTATGAFGPVDSNHSSNFLSEWPNGPPISSDHLDTLARHLTEKLPHTPLPLPKEEDTVEIHGARPTGKLRLTHIKAGFFQRHLIALVPTFKYDSSPDLPPTRPNDPDSYQWFTNDRRHILHRDLAAEKHLLEMLAGFCLRPLCQFFRNDELTPLNHHAFTLHDLNSPTLTDWLNLVENPEFTAITNAGWSIEIDPKGGFTVHDIDKFDTSLLPADDDDIDWFHFNVTAEFQGRHISLIPHIATAIRNDLHIKHPDPDTAPDILLPCENPADGHIRFPGPSFMRIVHNVRHLFHDLSALHSGGHQPPRLDRLAAAGLADALDLRDSETNETLANLGRNLRDVASLPSVTPPKSITAKLRPYQLDGFRWLQFLANTGLNGILADDMGLGKTIQTLAHLAAQKIAGPKKGNHPALIIAPTSVVHNWDAEAAKFTPKLKRLLLYGNDRSDHFNAIPDADLVITSYPLLVRDFDVLSAHHWRTIVLDEAQFIKNPKAVTSIRATKLRADHRICLSGTPMENHLGELWSLMRFLMPGFLGPEKSFNTTFRKAIEKDKNPNAQIALNRRVAPLILRRTKDAVAADLPEKTHIVHTVDLEPRQAELYESVRATIDERVRHAIASKGLARSHIIVLEALLKLRQICCHPQLLKLDAATRVSESAKLDFLTNDLLPTLIEEGRRILLFSQFTSMLELIEECLTTKDIPYLKLTGQTDNRASLVKSFQSGDIPIFLISLKAGGTGLNLTAADTVIHYDPWWNPAAENQATDRAHRIGQTKPVFVHKLVCRGTIEERILELQQRKAALVKALLNSETSSLKIDADTLSHLLAPIA